MMLYGKSEVAVEEAKKILKGAIEYSNLKPCDKVLIYETIE